MKKIFIFSKSSWNTFNFRKKLIQRLISQNHEITIFAEYDKYTYNLRKMGCKVVNLKYNNTNFNPFIDFINLIKVFNYFYFLKPEIILCFNLKPIILTNIINKFFRKKIISNLTGLGSAFDKKNIIYYVVINLYKFVLRNSFHVFFQNNDDLSLFKNLNIVKSNNSSVIPGSGVDIEEFFYKDFADDNKIVFLCASRLLKNKGIYEYCKAAEIVKKEYPNIIFNLVGSFEDSKRGVSKNIVHEFINKGVIFYKEHTDHIINEIHNSQCIVLPSHREGTSKILLEAMSCGRPIITTDSIGCKHLVSENYNGFLCKNKNYLSLSETLIKFINLSLSDKKRFSQNSREFIKKNYDSKFINNLYLQKINENPTS